MRDEITIIIGLAIGAAAHFGHHLASGVVPKLTAIIGYLLQLGIIGLIASVATKQMNVTEPDMRALVSAMLAISTQEVFKRLRGKAVDMVERVLGP